MKRNNLIKANMISWMLRIRIYLYKKKRRIMTWLYPYSKKRRTRRSRQRHYNITAGNIKRANSMMNYIR